VRGRGLFQAVELTVDRGTKQPFDPALKGVPRYDGGIPSSDRRLHPAFRFLFLRNAKNPPLLQNIYNCS
jgi:hypothetical protein